MEHTRVAQSAEHPAAGESGTRGLSFPLPRRIVETIYPYTMRENLKRWLELPYQVWHWREDEEDADLQPLATSEGPVHGALKTSVDPRCRLRDPDGP